MSARLTDRVARNYAPQDVAGSRSPIEIMSRIYSGMFGSGLKPAPASDESAGASDLVDIGIGTYLQTDPAIAEAVIAGMRAGNLHYLRRPEVNEAVARKYLDEQGVTLDPETQVFLTGGARTAMTLALLRYLEAGDRVIVPDPRLCRPGARGPGPGCGRDPNPNGAGSGWRADRRCSVADREGSIRMSAGDDHQSEQPDRLGVDLRVVARPGGSGRGGRGVIAVE